MADRKRQFNAFLIFIGCCALAWLMLDDLKKRQDAEAKAIGLQPRSEVDAFTVVRANSSTMQFKKTGADWDMVRPVYAPANPVLVDQLLELLALRPDDCISPDSIDLDNAGLSEPLAELTLATQTIAIGQTDALGSRRYLLTRHGVCSAEATTLQAFFEDSGYFVYKYLTNPTFELTQVAFKGEALTVDLEYWQQSEAAAVQRAGPTESCAKVTLQYGDANQQSLSLCRRGADFAFVPAQRDYELLIDEATLISLGINPADA
ncbi:MAG: hypothetical protein HWE20_04470 [Gammaproteobacteria bacterium]|nr:hypothetical protein [Gammaproteobacteria bacterium]